MKSIAAGAVAILLACGIAHADTNVNGWAVSSKPDNGVCTASREYKDSSDDDKENAVAFGLVKADNKLLLIVSFSYIDWNYDKGEKVTANLLIDNKTVLNKSKWIGDKHALTATFDESGDILGKFGNGKKVVLHFDDGPHSSGGDAIFFTPNAGMAIGAVQQCLDAK